MKTFNENKTWHTSKVNEFWGKIAFKTNVFHVYEDEDKFIGLLAGFVGTGINSGDCNIVIATKTHLEMLHQNLTDHGLHVDRLIEDERYYPIEADYLLKQFMINEMPDENLFFNCIQEVTVIGKKRHRKIRVFREMVSVLREMGHSNATTQLECFWNKFNKIEQSLIFCAYPKKILFDDECKSLKEIGYENHKVIRSTKSLTHVIYTDCLNN